MHHVQPRDGNTVLRWVLGSPHLFDPQYLYLPYLYEDFFHVTQKSDAGYVQLNFGNEEWKGNIGGRYVKTDVDPQGYIIDQTNFTQQHSSPTSRTRTATSCRRSTSPTTSRRT